jgi:hypothetical protein
MYGVQNNIRHSGPLADGLIGPILRCSLESQPGSNILTFGISHYRRLVVCIKGKVIQYRTKHTASSSKLGLLAYQLMLCVPSQTKKKRT